MTVDASPESRAGDGPLVEITNLTKCFPVKQSVFASVKGVVHAVEDVTLTVNRGETLGIVGESGCGKSTTARLMVRLLDADVRARSSSTARTSRTYSMRQLRPLRRQMQMIFQDPYSSLNPRKSVGQIVGEPFTIHKTEKDVRSGGCRSCSRASGSARSTTTATRTSSPAASASGSASPARSRCSRS